jgi:hypothetical protein
MPEMHQVSDQVVLLVFRHAGQFFLNLIERHTRHTIGAGHPKSKRGQQDNGPRGRGTFLNAETLKAAKSQPFLFSQFLLSVFCFVFFFPPSRLPCSISAFYFLLSAFLRLHPQRTSRSAGSKGRRRGTKWSR